MTPFTMHKRMRLLLAALLLAVSSQAQTLKEFFTAGAPLTYLGVDFTQARLLGDADAVTNDIRDRHFPAINNVIIAEPKKYDIAGAFHNQVTTDLAAVTKRNAAINPDKIKSDNSADFNHLKPADIDQLVQGFDFGGKKGIGLLLVMDGMSKTEKAATMHVTLVDMDNKKVLLTEELEGKAQGFGFRNYWAYTVHKVLEEVEKHRYKQWKAKYAN
ncbi:hypothetical protein [Chitinophaga japonensis]|uniref:DUF3313 domain-containing protein n=1 Tax=Chitinophaga japonensis TaxID=104662 RepID=A0A562T490_CHIJA|nr:hypothetical protein [Chitinophaga japonensis]TWI88355.1 hypothetical protein LX66_2440 [Chitinophaga japonensis]